MVEHMFAIDCDTAPFDPDAPTQADLSMLPEGLATMAPGPELAALLAGIDDAATKRRVQFHNRRCVYLRHLGWRYRIEADGTVHWTSPFGHTHTVRPDQGGGRAPPDH